MMLQGYFRIVVDFARMNVLLTPSGHSGQSMIRGTAIARPMTLPLNYTMEHDEDSLPLMYAFFPNVNLMSARFVQTLASVGVDNLQLFPARITDPDTGAVYDDYFAVNVIGLVECADMDKSDHMPLADLFFFHELVIHPEKTLGLPLFRLAESPIDIIVHERIAQAIRDANFPEIVLEPVSP